MCRSQNYTLAVIIAVGLGSCAKPVRSFRLVAGASGPTLIPPGVRDASVTTGRVPVKRGSRRVRCSASPSGLSVAGQYIAVSRDALARATTDEINGWLAEIAAAGCISADKTDLTRAVIDSLPLDLTRRRQLANPWSFADLLSSVPRAPSASFLRCFAAALFAAMTREIGVNPYLRVTVNGVKADIPVGSSVQQVIDQVGGRSAPVPPGLIVRKPHRGVLATVECDPKSMSILNLPIEGGEQISW